MPVPSRLQNESRRSLLTRMLAPTIDTVDRGLVRRAPYAVQPDIPQAQQKSLIDHALELGGPPGTVIAREIPTTQEGHTLEILLGWERLSAFTHPDAFPRAPSLPVSIISCNAADAVFYAIEFAALDQKAGALVTSPLLYATAAQTAIEHFSRPEEIWSIQSMANALCIARPTLSNRLRLLKGLMPKTRELLQHGKIKPEFAKILLAEPSPERQEQLATRAARGTMSTRSLYRLVHPGYEPPGNSVQARGQQQHRDGDTILMERSLSETYGAPTRIALDKKQQGSIEMEFSSLSELKGLLQRFDTTIQTDSLLKGSLSLSVTHANEANALLLELGANTDPDLT